MMLRRALGSMRWTLCLLAISAAGCGDSVCDPAFDWHCSDLDFVPCWAVEALFDHLVGANRNCSIDEDCATVTTGASCDCTPVLRPGGVAVNKSVAALAGALVQRFYSGGCARADSQRYCDGGFPASSACRDGLCVVDSWTWCNAWDGGE